MHAALWRTATRVERAKVNTWIASRNALGVAVPLAIGTALHAPLSAVAIATGALNVSFSDGYDPYWQRARRMLAWSLLGAVAVFTGTLTGEYYLLAVGVTALWAMVAGMLLAVGVRAGDLGLNTLVAVIVFAAHPLSAKDAFYVGLLVFAGGLLQTAFALLLWPVQRRRPEREAVGKAFRQLAEDIHLDADAAAATLDYAPAPLVQETLSALGRDHTTTGERYRLLFDQVDRIRSSVFQLRRSYGSGLSAPVNDLELRQMLDLCSKTLAAIGVSMARGEPVSTDLRRHLSEMKRMTEEAKDGDSPDEVRAAMERLVGQVRVVAQFLGDTLPQNWRDSAGSTTHRNSQIESVSWAETLRTNLSLQSIFFRHAIRLAASVALADAAGRSLGWSRMYWVPMTVAVILKPDFSSTFSRGGLRLLGTFGGLVLATVLYHVLPATPWTQLFLVGLFTLMLRSVGPANYGLFSAAIAGLVVFLIAATGVSPGETVVARGINTALGGLFALVAYAAWPTWERTQVRPTMAEMLDRCRHYIQTVAQRLQRESESRKQAWYASVEKSRRDWKLARSNAEASVDRLSGEPGARPEEAALLTSMLASSHSLAYSAMVLETELRHLPDHGSLEASRAFIYDVDFTLYFLAAALRGSPSALQGLPDLRSRHRVLLKAREELPPAYRFFVDETDRMTVSLNTLKEQVESLLEDASPPSRNN